jgi:hypothetical protein
MYLSSLPSDPSSTDERWLDPNHPMSNLRARFNIREGLTYDLIIAIDNGSDSARHSSPPLKQTRRRCPSTRWTITEIHKFQRLCILFSPRSMQIYGEVTNMRGCKGSHTRGKAQGAPTTGTRGFTAVQRVRREIAGHPMVFSLCEGSRQHHGSAANLPAQAH